MRPAIRVTSAVDDKFAVYEEPLPSVNGWHLVSQRYTANYASGRGNYQDLFVACSEESSEFRSKLLKSGYHLYMLFIGPKIVGRAERFPQYKLTSAIAAENITIIDAIEVSYPENDAERSLGLYEIEASDFAKSCYLLSKQAWSILLLSARPMDLVMDFEKIRRMVLDNSAGGATYYPSQSMDWRAFSKEFCPLGDIVVKTYGNFDDRERTVAYIQRVGLIEPKA
jgi:hypothetical protein